MVCALDHNFFCFRCSFRLLAWSVFLDVIDDLVFATLFSPEKFQLVQVEFQKNAFLALVVAAFTPLPFKAFTIAGGVLGVPLLPLYCGVYCGSGLSLFSFRGAVLLFSAPVRHFVERYFERLTWALAAGVAVLVVVYLGARQFTA